MDSSVSIQSIPPDQQKHSPNTSSASSSSSSSSPSSASSSSSSTNLSISPVSVREIAAPEQLNSDSSHQCPICLEEITSRSIINPCFHEFCRVCVFEWIRIKNVCPVCRQVAVKILFNINSDQNYDEFIVPAPPSQESTAGFSFIYNQIPWVSHLLANVNPIYVTRSLNTIEQRLKDCPTINFQSFFSFYQTTTNNNDLSEGLKAFRCFVYRYNLRSVKNNSGSTRLATVVFYRQNPALVSRLVDMLQFDIDSLQKLQHFTYSSSLLSEFHQLLFLHNIESTNFKNDFKRMFAQYCNLSNSSLNPAETLYHEISSFAKSKHSTIQEYAKNVMYSRNTRRDQSPLTTVNITSSISSSSSTTNNHNDNHVSGNHIFSVSISPVNTLTSTINNHDLQSTSSSANHQSTSTVTITAIPTPPLQPLVSSNTNNGDIEIITLESTSSDSDIQVINNQAKQQQTGSNFLENSKPGPSGINSNSFKNILSKPSTSGGGGGSRGKNPMKRPLASSSSSTAAAAAAIAIPSPSKRSKITPAYTRKEIMEMRRVIRNAQHSEYFFRKLLREIKKKFYDYDTILNSEHFAYLNSFYRDVFTNSKLFRSKLASCESSKRALSFEQIKRLLSRAEEAGGGNPKSSKKPTANQQKSQQSTKSSNLNENVSSTDSDDLSSTTLNLEQYEKNNRTTINEQIIKHAMSPPQSSAQSYVMFAKEKIKFNNRVYSDTD